MKTIAGVDEAGRGCVIGPLVIACVLFDRDSIESLNLIGVKDSKKLSSKKRTMLASEIKKMSLEWKFFELEPWAIDKVVERGVKFRRLNYLEAMAIARLICDLRPDRVIVDSVDVVPDRLVKQINRVIPWNVDIICKKKADTIFPTVSAASILAKVRRDERVSDLRKRFGDFGSGYCSDKKTISFLEKMFEEKGAFPNYVRSSWATINRIKE
jgi:ribonuclease HII